MVFRFVLGIEYVLLSMFVIYYRCNYFIVFTCCKDKAEGPYSFWTTHCFRIFLRLYGERILCLYLNCYTGDDFGFIQ